MEFLFQDPKRKDAHRLDGMLLAEEARVSTSSPCAEPGKVQTRSFWSFQPPKSSKCARLNFSQGRTLPRAWKSSNALFFEFSAPEKLKMRAFELFPRPSPSPSLEKFKRAHFGVFSPEKLKMCAFELSQGEPFPEPGKVQTRSFWSFQHRKAQNVRD